MATDMQPVVKLDAEPVDDTVMVQVGQDEAGNDFPFDTRLVVATD